MVKEEHLSVIISTAYMDEAERCAHVIVLHEGRVPARGTPEELKGLTDGLCHVASLPAGMKARTLQAFLLDKSSVVMDAVPEGSGVRFVLNPEDGKNGPPATLFDAPGMENITCRPVPSRLEDSFMLLLRHGGNGEGHTAQDSAPPGEERNQESSPYAPAGGSDAETVIEVRDLVRRFGSFTAVASTSFSVRRGEVFGLLGPNGAGKTTTFRMLCGLLPASGGHLCVAGENLRTAAAHARTRIGYVSQKFSLYGNLSVLENLRFFGGVYGLGPFALRRRIREVLAEFDLAGHEHDMSGNLPGGFKQRLSMAVGMLHRPEILFLDEPTSGIDPLARRVFWRRITSLSEEGTTIIITTHFMEEAEYCDRMLIQDAGRVLALGTPDEVRRRGGNAPTMEEAFIRIVEESREKRRRADAGEAAS